MPYLTHDQKLILKDVVSNFKTVTFDNPGVLNYLITELCQQYLAQNQTGKLKTNCYRDYNDVVGALESAKLEFYRRPVAEYEDLKLYLNGDVYKK